jgi:hypothetical protein
MEREKPHCSAAQVQVVAMNFRESLALTEGPRREKGTQEFFNVQAQFSRIRGYAEVAPEAVKAAADGIYFGQSDLCSGPPKLALGIQFVRFLVGLVLLELREDPLIS